LQLNYELWSHSLLSCDVLPTTWGDADYIGLTGVEVFGPDGRRIPIASSQVSAAPHSINALPGVSGDERTADKLVNGHNDEGTDE